MAEPVTIDEMLAWVSLMEEEWTRKYLPDPDESAELNDPHRHAKAIRAILEQHRAPFGLTPDQKNIRLMTYGDLERFKRETEIVCIRAFVERVEKKIQERGEWRSARIWDAVEQELAALEGEANAGTND